MAAFDYDMQMEVLASLSALVDNSWEIYDGMLRDGWDELRPHIDFECSFGDEAEVAAWQRYVVEFEKIWICTPNRRFRIYGRQFSSPYLDDIRSRRPPSVANAPFWMTRLDPIERRIERLRAEDRAEYERRGNDIVRQQMVRRREEFVRHVGSSRGISGWDTQDLSPSYEQVVEPLAAAMEFARDHERSQTGIPVYSRPILRDWSLCLHPEELRWHQGTGDGVVLPLLSLQRRPLRGRLKKLNPYSFLVIEYERFIYKFGFVHRRFYNADEFVVILMARLHLLQRVLDDVERALSDRLRRLA